ncbi:MAG: hypothetical protein MJ072_06480 [Clostridia bacterium]|nr:hypothetical protein [Clostridia bacterium]
MKRILSARFTVTLLLFVTVTTFLFSGEVFLSSAGKSLAVFNATVLPAVLPYAVACAFMFIVVGRTRLAKILHPFFSYFFGVNGYAGTCVLTGLFSGQPTGIRSAGESFRSGEISLFECEKVACLTSVASPLLVITCVGNLTYQSNFIGVIMFLSELVSALISLTVVGLNPTPSSFLPVNKEKTDDFETVLGVVESLSVAGGLSVLFYTLLTMTARLLTPDLSPLLIGTTSGIIETTFGCEFLALTKSPLSVALTNFILVLGGAPSLILTLNVFRKTKMRTARFFLFKAIQSALTFVITYFSVLPLR